MAGESGEDVEEVELRPQVSSDAANGANLKTGYVCVYAYIHTYTANE